MSNPFLSPSTLPFELPPFTEIREEHYLPAFEAGMAEQLAEVAAIAGSPEPPTFENTIEALERSGAVLNRVSLAFFNVTSSDTSPVLQAVDAETSPRLAAHSDAINLDQALFARIDALYQQRAELRLDPESEHVLERYHARFVRAGARLGEAERNRLKEINAELASAQTAFEQNVFADTRAAALVLDTADELAGLPASAIAAAAENGTALGHDGKYVLSLKSYSNQPELESLDDPTVRRRLLAASLGRGAASNPALIRRMVVLRAERAALLGFESHADYVVRDQTAGTVEAVESMLTGLVGPAVANARREAEALAAEAGVEQIEAADWKYWSEKVRKARYQVDASVMRPYLELESVIRNGAFFAAEQVYGITFTERTDLAGYHPEARVFEVTDADGSPIGLFIGDWFARESKRGGAWMNELVTQSHLLDRRPVVVNNLNIVKPPAGEPALLSWDEVTTLFHEFGHALHGLLSDVRYPLVAGTEVARDFVEYPSQVNEMWAEWPLVLDNFARHHVTGEAMPAGLVERMKQAEAFGEGFRTVEYLAAALLDWAWHTVPAEEAPHGTAAAVEAFERAALERYGVAMPEIPVRYRSGYFAHIFSGEWYAAGYYGYIWSEVLDADTVEWFKENGKTIRESGEIFRRELLSVGGSKDALAAFAAFRGRGPEVEPLLVRRGLAR
ncbi:M3 family metallopeptidase [Streptacidiphilus carbonis]|uniref:M3 family metallopeptidase n=1 Tax=Streptacidiphilus carbonis TaxID=105422 RepID=UPI0006940CF9|nr:M3 family metallopeptidase [Streptacidiphilus carbonis]